MTGCMAPVNIAWRGVIHSTQQEATTEGRIDNKPGKQHGAVAAEKTTDARVNASEGSK